MVTLRADKRKNGYSLYLDIYHNKKRTTERLKLFVSEDYTKPITDKKGNPLFDKYGKPKKHKILPSDKANWTLAIKLRDEKQDMLNHKGTSFMHQISETKNFVAYFEENLRDKNNSTYDYAFKHLKNFRGDTILFKDIDIHFLNDFKKYLSKCESVSKNKLSENTIKIYLKCCKIIWAKAIKEKHTLRNPFANFNIPKGQNPKQVYLYLDDVKKIARLKMTEEKREQVRKAFLFSCFTGLRKGDMINLTWSNIIKNEYIEIRQEKSKKDILTIPLHQTVIRILESIEKKYDKVFYLLDYNSVNVHIKEIGKEAKLDNEISFHTARHSCATILYEHGVDLYTISKILGHSNIDITKIYTHLREDKKQEAINKIPEIEIVLL